jgi:hypothetical protein
MAGYGRISVDTGNGRIWPDVAAVWGTLVWAFANSIARGQVQILAANCANDANGVDRCSPRLGRPPFAKFAANYSGPTTSVATSNWMPVHTTFPTCDSLRPPGLQ